ncbi:MAG: uroporphyrinogen decarboxylase family protein [Planctomycetota bacterium]|jgi:uroporphyrinogen decarboxylase
MTHRERYLQSLTFGSPDRVPFSPGGPRESTLAAWRTQGLPEGANWHEAFLDELGLPREAAGGSHSLGVRTRMIPEFEEKVLEHAGGHYVVQDWKGNVCEISDEFDVTYLRTAKDFVTRRWIRCPVESRADWERMKERYDPEAPERVPADIAERAEAAGEAGRVLSIHLSGPFWQMREWCGFEGLCMMTIEDPELVEEMADFWRGFVSRVLDRAIERAAPDALFISEDMAYKAKSMISPAMARRFLAPCYREWSAKVKGAGAEIVDMDSDGFIGELVPIWIETGVNVCDPLEVAAGNDIVAMRREFGRRIAYRGGVDKRAIAKGGDVIRAELDRVAPVVADGGYVPGCDHGVPSDVSWPAFLEYARGLARITGWL